MVGEIILINEFLWDVGYFDAHILWSIHRCHEVEILDIKTCTFRISTGKDAVDDQLYQVKPCSRGAEVAWVADAVASNFDSCPIGFFLLLSHFPENFGLRDFMLSVGWDICIVNYIEGIRSFRALLSRAFGSRANTLAEAPKFIRV